VAVNVTMKSGTNSFQRARAWEYNTHQQTERQELLLFAAGPNLPKFINNQFGLTSGGPYPEKTSYSISPIGNGP